MIQVIPLLEVAARGPLRVLGLTACGCAVADDGLDGGVTVVPTTVGHGTYRYVQPVVGALAGGRCVREERVDLSVFLHGVDVTVRDGRVLVMGRVDSGIRLAGVVIYVAAETGTPYEVRVCDPDHGGESRYRVVEWNPEGMDVGDAVPAVQRVGTRRLSCCRHRGPVDIMGP